MKKVLIIFIPMMILTLVSSCTGCGSDNKKDNNENNDSVATTNENNDTIGNDTTVVVDNTPLTEMEKLMEDKPMPKAADELFDDFFFNFSNNRKVQKERIQWPLRTVVNGASKAVNENGWQMERFFSDEEFYVMLLDDVNQTKLAKDTTISNVTVKHVNIPGNMLQNYNFKRIDGRWMMTDMEIESLSESRNAGFLKFYQKFATDSIACKQGLAESISFTGPDEEDDTKTTTRNITPDEYDYWAPELATDFFTVAYGQKNESSNNKVFIMRQPSSSQECRMFFRRQGSQWKLYKLEE